MELHVDVVWWVYSNISIERVLYCRVVEKVRELVLLGHLAARTGEVRVI